MNFYVGPKISKIGPLDEKNTTIPPITKKTPLFVKETSPVPGCSASGLREGTAGPNGPLLQKPDSGAAGLSFQKVEGQGRLRRVQADSRIGSFEIASQLCSFLVL